MKRTKVSRWVVAAAAFTVALGGSIVIGQAPASAAPTRSAIVSIAKRELANDSRNYEVGTNCSYYGGEMFGWPACGGKAGWGGGYSWHAWCAAFAKYVWREGGVTSYMSEVDGMAASFKSYGQDHGTWRSRSSGAAQPGDAVVFDWEGDGVIDHVGIVTAVSNGNLYTIEGNTGDAVKAKTYTSYRSNSDIVGYSSPVGLQVDVPRVGNSVTGDSYTDLIGRKPNGDLWLYPNNIERDNGVPYSSADARQIGSSWTVYNLVFGADVTGDGYTDLVGRKPNGDLWLYPNNIERDNGVPYSSPDARQIGSSWSVFNLII